MRHILTLLALTPLAACIMSAPATPPPEGLHMALTVTGGESSAPSAAAADFDKPWALAAQVTAEQDNWPVGFEVALQFGAANGTNATEYRNLDLSDFTIGATRQWQLSPHLTLVAGGGLRIAHAILLGPGWIFESELDDDHSVGFYAHAGLWWMFQEHFGAGVDARYADGSDFRLEGDPVDAQSSQLLLGLRWAF